MIPSFFRMPEIWYTSIFYSKYFTIFYTGGHNKFFFSMNSINRYCITQNSLRDTDIYLGIYIKTFALEHLMRFYMHYNI